jgi:hypothetical protein
MVMVMVMLISMILIVCPCILFLTKEIVKIGSCKSKPNSLASQIWRPQHNWVEMKRDHHPLLQSVFGNLFGLRGRESHVFLCFFTCSG